MDNNIKQVKQTFFWIEKFTDLANEARIENKTDINQYWKGQVMGICKMVDFNGIERN